MEVIVAVAIFLVSVLILGDFIRQAFDSNRFTLELSDAINFAKKGIDTMEKELREASYADNGDYPLASSTSQSIIFYSDIDTDEMSERVRYFLEGTELKKGVINPTGNPAQYLSGSEVVTTISQYIRNGTDPIFYYYNGDYPADTVNNPLPNPVNVNRVKLIRMILNVNIDPIKAPGDFNLEIFVQPRNLKNNL